MKKIGIALLIVLLIVTPCTAGNIFDVILYKDVLLRANKMHVLVTRITGKVKFLKLNSGNWILLKGALKNQCQAMYDAQTTSQ